ncbi:MAG TPA: ABC transporter substrate-binding protein [Streptosporangiaceae bacterium]|nr:ABC transporter substrate-binding protein [Streptosporangiaceae bacterium]
MLNYTNAIGANIEDSEYLMWRPLYWFGGPNSVGLNAAESIAKAPQITKSGKNTVATIQLKPFHWSDGAPVTTRDVQFWLNLLKVNPLNNWWGYVPGQFPDNVTNFKINSPTEFTMTFKGTYSPAWLYNQLGQIIPIPQHAWDKESGSGKVGDYDLSPAGAKKVVNYLLAQNKVLSSYGSNPLWQTVDGPWKITSYAPSTGDADYVRNMKFSGPATGSIHALKVISYSSDTAEFDSLLSAGGITYGYVPYNDAAEISRVKGDGYGVQAWPSWGITYITLNFGSPQAGPIFRQLYVRQAMQHLINQAGYISSFLEGYANPTYGPVPLVPKSKFVSSQQAKNPYPYNPAQAVQLLKTHGWNVVPNGTSTCSRPGSGPTDCGPGIAAGAKLTFSLEYATGTTAGTEEDAALQSAFAQAGIKVNETGTSFNNAIDDDTLCSGKSSCWQMNYYNQGWYFDPGYNDPDGTVLFRTGAVDNSGAYNDTTANGLMDALPSGGYPALYKYENYLGQQLPVLWMPEFDSQISAVNSKLKGAYPQDPLNNIYPENWYFTK